MLDAKFWKSVGINTVACYRRHIFGTGDAGKSAKDIYGKGYKSYSVEYGKLKRTGSMFRQSSEFKDSKAPVLSGDLALSIKGCKKFKVGARGFGFGSLTQRGKIKHLAEMGRVITAENKPLPDKCAKYLMTQADKYVDKELRKIKGGTFNIG